MTIIGLTCDVSRVRNTGKPTCVKKYGTWRNVIPVPKDWSLTAAQMATFVASMQALLVENNYDERGYLIGPFTEVTIANGDKVTISNQDGSENVVRAAVAGWDCIVKDGGMCFSRAMLSFDDMQDTFNIVIVAVGPKGHTFIGTEKWNATTEEYEFAGLDVSKLEAPLPMVGDGSETDRYGFNIRLADSDQLFKNGMTIDTTINANDDLVGVTDVTLTQLSAISGAGTVLLAMAAGCGAINLATSSTAATWANIARFNVTNYTTGAAITKTSVTVSNSAFSLDVDSSDPDYPTSGNYLAVELVDIATLASAGLEYFESYANNPGVGVSGKKLLIKVP